LEEALELRGALIPKAQLMSFDGIKSLDGVRLVEFDHGFYHDKFRDIRLSA
jgi:hypothetical protein